MIVLGVVLVIVALVLLLAEAHLTSGGLIGGGAVLALLGGVVALLLAAHTGLLAVALVVLAVGAGAFTGLTLLVRSMRSVRRLRPRSGTEAMIGRVGVLRVADDRARVFVDGTLWKALPSPLEQETLHDGEQVVVDRVDGLTLAVRRAEEWECSPWS